MKILTVGTHNKGYYDILQESCKRNDLELINLGWGKEWKGFTMRYDLMDEYLDKQDDNEIIMFIDAYDVFLLEGEKEILKKFHSYKKNIVFGLQNGLFPTFTFTKCDGNVLCGGSYMGYSKSIKELLKTLKNKELYKKYNNDDQELLNNMCVLHRGYFNENVAFDLEMKLFFITDATLFITPSYILNGDIGLKIKDNKLLNLNDLQPSVVHLAGNVSGKKYLEYLNYDISSLKETDISFKAKQTYFIIKNTFHKKYVKYIFVLVILLYIYSKFRKINFII